MLVWIGQFGQESDFEKYMDQTAFYKWWKEYDEDNKKLCCQFCKELGIMNYDSDFLIMKYSSIGLKDYLMLFLLIQMKLELLSKKIT